MEQILGWDTRSVTDSARCALSKVKYQEGVRFVTNHVVERVHNEIVVPDSLCELAYLKLVGGIIEQNHVVCIGRDISAFLALEKQVLDDVNYRDISMMRATFKQVRYSRIGTRFVLQVIDD